MSMYHIAKTPNSNIINYHNIIMSMYHISKTPNRITLSITNRDNKKLQNRLIHIDPIQSLVYKMVKYYNYVRSDKHFQLYKVNILQNYMELSFSYISLL